MENLHHIFGDVLGDLKNLLPPKYKIVAKYKNGKFEQIDTASTRQEGIFLMEGYRKAYKDGWTIVMYNIED